jgi:predicted nuclease of predicted toxin-antitoxin system
MCKNCFLHDATIHDTVAYKNCHSQSIKSSKYVNAYEIIIKRSWTTLKILLDEMYAGLKEYFETLGWEVLTVQDAGLQGARDKDVVEYAKNNNLLLVTQDQKPAELAELRGVKHVLISNAMIAKIADAKIREKYPNVK